jgi:hypothetical protein
MFTRLGEAASRPRPLSLAPSFIENVSLALSFAAWPWRQQRQDHHRQCDRGAPVEENVIGHLPEVTAAASPSWLLRANLLLCQAMGQLAALA